MFGYNFKIESIKNFFSTGEDRTLKLKKNIVAMFCIRGVAMLISFLYVPLLYGTLDAQNYGIWLSLTSLVAWISMFDIGLGNGLRNKLAISIAHGDYALSKKYISTAYVSITAIVLLIITLFLCIKDSLSWSVILNAENLDVMELKTLVTVVIISFCINLQLNLINSILYALQQPALSAFIMMFGQLLSYLTVLLIVKVFNISSLLVLGSIISVIPVFVILLFTGYIFYFKHRELLPRICDFDSVVVRDILSLGGQFFVIQIITYVLYQSNNLIITHTVGNEAVVEYNLAYKYMYILVMLFGIIATPLWSATTDAYAKGDFTWIRNANRKLLMIVACLSIGGFFMLVASPLAYRIWLGDSYAVNWSTTLLLYAYSVFMMLYGCYGYLINGIGVLRVQLIATTILAILYIPLSIIAGKLFGLSGILVVFVIFTFINYLWSKIQYSRLINQTATGIWAK